MNFSETEDTVARLRQELSSGRMTEEQFKSRLKELMLQDDGGNWWMIGYETGKWYRHDGKDWVRADPPGYNAQAASAAPTIPPGAQAPAGIQVPAVGSKKKTGLTVLALVLLGVYYLGLFGNTCKHPDLMLLLCLAGFALSVWLMIKVRRGQRFFWVLGALLVFLIGMPYGHAHGMMTLSPIFGFSMGAECQVYANSVVVIIILLFFAALVDAFHYYLVTKRV